MTLDPSVSMAAFNSLVEAATACEDTELQLLACIGSDAPCEDALGRLFAALNTVRAAP